MEASGNFSAASGKRPLARVFRRGVPRYEGPRRYCRHGVLSVNPARRNASAIASPLTYPGLLEPARARRVGDVSPIQPGRFLRVLWSAALPAPDRAALSTRSDGVLGRPPTP